MKKIKIIYWIVTILFAAFMIYSAAGDIMRNPEAMAFITNLGYPEYFIPFLSWAKVLGAIAIVVPGFPRIKEWAYAGLVFDLVGATYSFIATGVPVSNWAPMLIFIAIAFTSYFLYHKVYRNAVGNAA